MNSVFFSWAHERTGLWACQSELYYDLTWWTMYNRVSFLISLLFLRVDTWCIE